MRGETNQESKIGQEEGLRMDEATANRIAASLDLISKALCILCVSSEAIVSQPLGVQARMLKSIGLENGEIADILNSTANSIGVRLAETKSWRAGWAKTPDDQG